MASATKIGRRLSALLEKLGSGSSSARRKIIARDSIRKMCAAANRSRGRKTHVHIENNRDLGQVFEFTTQALEAARRRSPLAKKRLSFTVGYDADILEDALKTADALIGWNFDRRDLARRAPQLRWIHSIGAGVEHMLPLDWVPRAVTLTNNRGVHGERATEYIAAAVLMLNNRIPEMVGHQQDARWVPSYNTSNLQGKTLLILGVGSIGGAAARWASGFGLDVIGIRRSGKPAQWRAQDILPPGGCFARCCRAPISCSSPRRIRTKRTR